MVKIRPRLDLNSFSGSIVAKSRAGRYLLAFIEEHIVESELSVEQMADAMGMSRANLYRRMVSATGSTPSEFIKLIRLRHAERLLMQSGLSVSEICYEVGFTSPRYFSKCYKELYGYLPSEAKRGNTK